MSKIIYNEGRVVGYSAYEIYVKQALGVDPDTPPASEREWLASSLAMGSSMLLYVPEVSGNKNELTYIDIKLPANSKLCTANTIIASYFDGEGYVPNNSYFATRVTDYGNLISNTSELNPSTSDNVPVKSNLNISNETITNISNYIKIVDGIVIQPGTWKVSNTNPPQKDFVPDFKGVPTIRLLVNGSINKRFFILLTGFTLRSIIQGESKFETALETDYPENGDFLGPESYPWANKIVFSVPQMFVNYILSNGYSRKLPKNEQSKTVDSTPIIDMSTTDPGTYYVSNHPDAREPINVTEFHTLEDNASVITVYQRNAIYPPAMYGTLVSVTGDNYLHPLDVVAPGTVKAFKNASKEELQHYQDTFPGTFGINITDDGTIGVLDKDGNLVDTSDLLDQIELSISDIPNTSAKYISISNKHTGKSVRAISFSNSSNTGPLTITDKGNYCIDWVQLLNALVNNSAIDIKGYDHGSNYIQFPNGLRLYISGSNPGTSGVPTGSIGIGW